MLSPPSPPPTHIRTRRSTVPAENLVHVEHVVRLEDRIAYLCVGVCVRARAGERMQTTERERVQSTARTALE